MEQKKFDEAEAALQKAFSVDPKYREAQYNLAQIPFKKKDYATARTRLEALFAATPGDEKNQAAQLIKFKIFMTLLLESKDESAQKMMEQFKFTGDTPALYYAQAAWSFKHGNPDQGNDWIVSARKIYSPALNIVFADSLYDVGWLTHPTEGAPATSALAQADASPPPAEATPAMRFGQADSLPAPVMAGGQSAYPAAAGTTTTATGIAPGGTKPGPVTSSVVAGTAPSSPAPAIATTAPPLTVAAATKQPQPKPAAVGTRKSVASPVSKQAVPPIVTAKSAVTPATTALASAQVRELGQSTFGEMVDRAANPRTLLFGGLLLGGVLLLLWLVVQQVRHHLPTVGLYHSSVPVTEPTFGGDSAMAGDERKIAPGVLAAGPPKLSLQLKASEPSLRKGIVSSGTVVVRGAAGEERPSLSPNEIERTVSEPPKVSKSLPEIETQAIAPELARPEGPAFSEQPAIPEVAPAAVAPEWELVPAEEKPVAQGQPTPQFTAARTTEPDMPRFTQPEPKSAPVPTVPEIVAAETATAGERAAQSSVETPSFASKIITTKPQPTIPVIMPESTTTPVPAVRPSSSTIAVQQPSGGLHTAVQLTFSLEIASMQLTPTFKMSGLQLKPMSKVVTMRLAPSQHPQPPMNLQVTFEVARIDLAGGGISTIRLTPSAQEKPAVLSSSSFPISGLELMPGAGSAPVQLTPSHQEQASVHLTAAFQIAAIEFSPLFEIVAIVLNSTSKNVSMQLPGSGPSSIDGAPIFQIENVELGGNNELSTIQVNPLNPSSRRALT